MHGSPGRVESAIDDLANDLPCDFLVLKDRGFDPERVLVPTAGGPDSELSIETARQLQAEYGSEVTVLHVANSWPDGEEFREEWAESHDTDEISLRIEVGDVEDTIERVAVEHSLVIIGATERGLLSRLARGTLVMDVIDDIECSVLLAERARDRSLLERLLGD